MDDNSQELDVLSGNDVTNIDRDEGNILVDRVLELQSLRYFKHEIKIKLEEELSTSDKPITIEWHLLLRLVAAANRRRERLLKRPTAEVKCDAITFYETMIRSEETKAGDKIRSQERLDLLFGLERGGMEGDTPEDKAAKAREALKQALGQMEVPRVDDEFNNTNGQMDTAQVSSAATPSVDE